MILVSGSLAIITAVVEIYLFSFVGNLVDWLAESDRAGFWEAHKVELFVMGGVALIVIPGLKFGYEATIHQGLLASFAMRTRYQAHRYLLKQSVEFFQNDFA